MLVSNFTGVLVALPVEANSLTKNKLFIGQTLPLSPRLVLHITGMGADRAHFGALHLIRCGAGALMSWGIAGGLAPNLTPGKLILPDAVMNEQNQIFEADTVWRNKVFNELKKSFVVSHEPLLQARELVVSPHDKQRLFSQYKAAAVDMESAAIAMAAWQAKIKFMAVRSIVDSAEMAFPLWLRPCLTEHGEIKLNDLFRKLFHPKRIADLFFLFRAFSLAKASLKTAAMLMDFSEELVQPIVIPLPETEGVGSNLEL